jgi:anti-sigma factor RsiW
VNEASASYDVSLARQRMHSQIESTLLDRKEIGSATGLTLPDIPDRWAVGDVQVFPSAMRMSVAMVLITEHGETVSLFIKHAETPAGDVPLLARGDPRSVAFWEKGPVAYALTGELGPERMLALSAELARAGNRS